MVSVFVRSILIASLAASAGCATEGASPSPQPAQAPPPASTAVQQTDVIFYPAGGQSPAQQDRDRYECYLWAAKQSGFDPSQASLAPPQRVEVRSATPPGAGVATGAIVGAAIGAAIGSPHDEGEGAIVGAMAGAVLGAAAESSQQAQAAQAQSQYDTRANATQARIDAQAGTYRRAMTACLEGRGYTVR